MTRFERGVAKYLAAGIAERGMHVTKAQLNDLALTLSHIRSDLSDKRLVEWYWKTFDERNEARR